MKVRAKFTVLEVTVRGYGGKTSTISAHDKETGQYVDTGVPVRQITLSAQYDQRNPEDVHFSQATPVGSMTFQLDNPALKDEFKPGQAYYIDMTPVETAEAAPAAQ